jgi:hypothetical protein
MKMENIIKASGDSIVKIPESKEGRNCRKESGPYRVLISMSVHPLILARYNDFAGPIL